MQIAIAIASETNCIILTIVDTIELMALNRVFTKIKSALIFYFNVINNVTTI